MNGYVTNVGRLIRDGITTFDALCLVGAFLTVVPWLLTHDPTLFVVFATIIDVSAFFPTIRKTYRQPYTETLSAWAINLLRHGMAILALASYSLATYVYPAALLVMNAVVVAVILSQRRKNQR